MPDKGKGSPGWETIVEQIIPAHAPPHPGFWGMLSYGRLLLPRRLPAGCSSARHTGSMPSDARCCPEFLPIVLGGLTTTEHGVRMASIIIHRHQHAGFRRKNILRASAAGGDGRTAAGSAFVQDTGEHLHPGRADKAVAAIHKLYHFFTRYAANQSAVLPYPLFLDQRLQGFAQGSSACNFQPDRGARCVPSAGRRRG